MNKKTENNLLKKLLCLIPYLIAAILSTAIGIIVFKHRQIAPFGEKSVLCMDLWGQYFSMYVNNKSVDSISDLFHSWNGALGFNNWTQSAYYCNSIFVILLRLFPYAQLVKMLDIFCLVKIAISSMTCLGMLRFKSRSHSPVLIGGAVGYSLCSYMIAYISQFMWTDLMMYAPLIVVGIDLLIEKKKPLLYVVFLALSIFTSFYIGFSMCIFSALYFLTRIFLQMHLEKDAETGKHHISGVKDMFFSAVRFALYSLIGGSLSAFIIIPVAMGISQTLAVEAPSPEKLEWYGNFTAVLQNCLPYTNFFQEYKGANIFCGIMVFLSVPLYFTNKSFRKAERFTSAVFLVFLIASLNCNILNYIWHGFHFPNQLPGRWSFLLSLYLILLGSTGLARFEGLTLIRSVIGSAIGLGLLCFTQKGLGETESRDIPKYAIAIIIIAAAAVILSSLIRFIMRKNDEKKKFCTIISHAASAVIACLMVFDMGKNLVTVCDYEGNKGFQVSDETTYTAQIVRHVANGERIKSGSDDFYRVEDNIGFTFNPTMMDNCKGMSYYSSTMNGNAFTLLKFLGNRVYADKVNSVYNISSPVQNSLFGIKYFIDYSNNLASVVPGTVAHMEGDNDFFTVPIKENTTALPIVYSVSDDILQFKTDNQIRGLDNHMSLLSAMLGAECKPYIEFEPDSVEPVNCSLDYNDNLDQQFFYRENDQQDVSIKYTYTAPRTGFYFFSHNFRAGSIHLLGPNLDKTVNSYLGAFNYCGYFDEGAVITADFEVADINLGCHGLTMYYMDEGIWDKAYRQLAADGIDITKASGTVIEGDVELSESKLMLMTAVQDGGWEVSCRRRKLPTNTAVDVFPCFRISEGKHHLVMKYHVPGFRYGALISLFALLALIIPEILIKKHKPDVPEDKKSETPVTVADNAESETSDEENAEITENQDETSKNE